MKIDLAVREAHDAERELTELLLRVGERHEADHDVFHMTRTLSRWSTEHVRRLAEQGARLGTDLGAEPDRTGLPSGLGEEDAGVTLLRDVRDLHLAAARASLAWTMLGQGAQAAFDTELLEVVTASHPQTVRTLKWTVQKVKEAAPQVLA